MAHKHPKDRVTSDKDVFPSEDEMAQKEAELLQQMRKASGGLPDSSTEPSAQVRNKTPFKNLKG